MRSLSGKVLSFSREWPRFPRDPDGLAKDFAESVVSPTQVTPLAGVTTKRLGVAAESTASSAANHRPIPVASPAPSRTVIQSRSECPLSVSSCIDDGSVENSKCR